MRSINDVLAVLLVSACALCLCSVARAEEGYATYYTTKSCQKEGTSGIWTASGERFDESAMTCALRNRHYGHFWAVYGQVTGRMAFVRNNDYGPGNGPKRAGVVIDLTPAAFRQVCGDLAIGKCKVNVQQVLT